MRVRFWMLEGKMLAIYPMGSVRDLLIWGEQIGGSTPLFNDIAQHPHHGYGLGFGETF